MAYDVAAFRKLQSRLGDWWPALTIRAVPARPRVLVVVSSMTIELPPSILPMVAAYEERYLCYVMALARSQHTRVIHVTSQPILPRLATYHLGLVKDLRPAESTGRLTVVSVGDPSPRPLSQKILDRPLLIERLRRLIGDPTYGLLMPFLVTGVEAELAVALGIPTYGPDPELAALGYKTGSRQVFAAAGVPLPRGFGELRDRGDIVEALLTIQRTRPVRRAVVKLDAGFSGLGNAIVALGHADSRRAITAAVNELTPDDPSFTSESFLDAFARGGGGVAEEWIEADQVCSPSVQLRASPLGEVEVLSTHDQVLGGPGGQTYLGCRFPASPPFIGPLTSYGRAIASELSQRGVIGRFAVDFVVARQDGGWRPYAVEVNLRNGGTTHPFVTLAALTDGEYDEPSGQLVARTGTKHYAATDHLERPEYMRLTPDDVLDVVTAEGLGWDPVTEAGVALHMVSGVAIGGSLGATAIGDSAHDADELMTRLRIALDDAAEVGQRLTARHVRPVTATPGHDLI